MTLMNLCYLLFVGYYQPAGPLINPHPHLVGGPQNLTKQPTSSPLDSESILQQSQQSSSVGEGNEYKFHYINKQIITFYNSVFISSNSNISLISVCIVCIS